MSQPINSIKVSLYGIPSPFYLSVRSCILNQSAALAAPIDLKEIGDTSRFIEESIKRIPACKVNDRWILPDEADHSHFIGRVKFELSMEDRRSIFQNIVVPIDFSDNAANALLYASGLAEDLGLSMTVMHAMHPVQATTVDTPFNMAEQIKRQKENLGAFVSDLAHQAPLLADRDRVDVRMSIGLAAGEIVQHALDIPGSMIVMGATGLDLQKKFFGSVSLSVINRAAVPVLIVPAECAYSSITTIKYAGAFEDADLAVIPALSAIVSRTRADIEIIHVQRGSETYFSERLEAALCRNTGRVVKSRTIKGNDVFTSLNEFCLETESDLLVMARAKGNVLQGIFHKSITKAMSSRTHVPLLIVPQN